MTEGVVDALEMVDVGKQHGERRGAFERTLYGVAQGTPPERARERVDPLARAQVVAFAAQPIDCVAHALVAQMHAQPRPELHAPARVERAIVVGPREQGRCGLLRLGRARADEQNGDAAEGLHGPDLTAQLEGTAMLLDHHQDQVDGRIRLGDDHLGVGHGRGLIALAHTQPEQLGPRLERLGDDEHVLEVFRPQRRLRLPRHMLTGTHAHWTTVGLNAALNHPRRLHAGLEHAASAEQVGGCPHRPLDAPAGLKKTPGSSVSSPGEMSTTHRIRSAGDGQRSGVSRLRAIRRRSCSG